MQEKTLKYRHVKVPKQRDRYYSEEGQAYEYKRRRTPKSRWMRAKCNARKRKKEFTLTLAQYEKIIANPCKYCKVSIEDETGSGLDRIDNEKGYIPGNCNASCGSCNRRRHRSMEADEFEKQTELNNYIKKN